MSKEKEESERAVEMTRAKPSYCRHPNALYDRELDWMSARHSNLVLKREARDMQERANSPFRPEINPISRAISAKRRGMFMESQGERADSPGRVFLRKGQGPRKTERTIDGRVVRV